MNLPNISRLKQFFVENGKAEIYRKGMVILKAPALSPGIFYIAKGCVEVRSAEKGGERLFAIYKAGELFPLLWALQDVQKRFIYKAYTDCEVLIVSKTLFNKTVSTDLNVAQEIIQQLAIYCDIFLTRIDHLEIPRAYDRVLQRLLFFAKRFGTKKQDEIVINIPITHETIAESLSISRETTSRIMKRLKDEGFIHYANHSITLKHKLLLTSLFTSFFLNITPDIYAI